MKLRNALAGVLLTSFVIGMLDDLMSADQPADSSLSNDPIIEGLRSSDGAIRVASYARWHRSQTHQIDELITLLKSPGKGKQPRSTKALAARMLGELRSTRAIPVLIENLNYEEQFGEDTESSTLSRYPCALALAANGLDSLPDLFWHLKRVPREEISDKSIELICDIVLMIFGAPSDRNGGWAEARVAIDRFRSRHPNEALENLEPIRELRQFVM